jgi:hypothetical protein
LVSQERQDAEQAAYAHMRENVAGQRGAIENLKDAEDDVAQADIQANNARAEGHKKIADEHTNAGIDVQSRALADREKQDAFREKIDAFSQDLANDRIKVDASPSRQVTWTIAKALGSIGQAFLNLPTNQVADQIDAQIRQDIENQKANHDIKKGRLGDMKTLYDLAASQSKDQAERDRLAHGYALEAAKSQLQAMAEASGNPKALAVAKKLKAEWDMKSQLTDAKDPEIELAAVQRGIAENKWVPAGVAGGAGKPVEGKFVYFDPTDGKYYDAKSEPNHKELTKAVLLQQRASAAGQKYLDTLKGLGFFEKLAGKGEVDSKAMSAARGAHIAYLDDVREINAEGGVIREGLKKAGVYEHSIVSPDKLTGDAEAQIQVTLDRVKNLSAETKKILDPTPVVKSPQGYGTAPKNTPTGQSYKAPPKTTTSSVGFSPLPKARGGDVEHEQPYLVGEEGPELVVPNKPGFVLTALQTAALKGAPPTRQQMETLPPGAKSAIQRFAEKAGVAREDGGAVAPAARRPPTPEELEEDERKIREFMGSDQDAKEQADKIAYLQREAEREARSRAADEEARRQQDTKRQKSDAEAREVEELGPVRAWVNRTGRSIGQDIRSSPAATKALYDAADRFKSANRAMHKAGEFATPKFYRMDQEDMQRGGALYTPEFVKDWKKEHAPVRQGQFTRTDPTAGEEPYGPPPPPRQPVSFERDPAPVPARADGGEVLPLYEPPGLRLQQTADGHAYFASEAEDRPSGASLSGPTPRYSAHPLAPEARPAPPPRPPARREMTPEELMRWADSTKAGLTSDHEARMAEGPAVKARAQGGAMHAKGLAASISRDFKKAKRAG